MSKQEFQQKVLMVKSLVNAIDFRSLMKFNVSLYNYGFDTKIIESDGMYEIKTAIHRV